MKFFLLFAALLLQTPAPRGAVTGSVVVSGTSSPIADAEVAIVTPDGVLETSTDTSGRFTLADVPAGRQTVVIRADGFFVEAFAPNTPPLARVEVPVTVTAGATPVTIPSVLMVQGGTIIGRVIDPLGNPVPFVRVQALRPGGGALNSGIVPDVANRTTDDRGEYRMFFVPPGEYVVRAQFQGPRPISNAPTPTGQLQTLVSTLFPNTTDMAEAGKVTVKSGEEIRGIDIAVKMDTITIPTAPAPPPGGGFKITGVVVDRVLPWVGTALLMLGSENDAAAPRQVGTAIVGGTPGEFAISGIPPGKYDLFARMENGAGSPGPGGGVQAWGRASVEIRDRDVENVRLTIHPSPDVPGVVKIDGKPAPAGGSLKIGLSATGTAGRLNNYRGILDRTQSPDENGKVLIPRAAEGNYQVFVQGADNLFVADVRQGDASILAGGIDVRDADPTPFEVQLSSNGGTVEGVVSFADKSPMDGAIVLLVPADRQMLASLKTATAGADGKYSIQGVRPGDYKVFAGKGLTAEALPRIEPQGVSVTVKALSSTRADVEGN